MDHRAKATVLMRSLREVSNRWRLLRQSRLLYERDANSSDEAMFRRYNRWHSRFD